VSVYHSILSEPEQNKTFSILFSELSSALALGFITLVLGSQALELRLSGTTRFSGFQLADGSLLTLQPP
jgi:hypothetical protein